MKFKRFATLVLAAVMVIGFMPITTKASTKTATLHEARISFNGKEPVTVQSYLIDNRNFVRAREITDGLNMKIGQAIQTGGVMITPTMTAEAPGTMERIVDKTISVNIVKMNISYGGRGYEAEAFLYNNRYYYRLVDIEAASMNALDSHITLAEANAALSSNTGPRTKTFDSINVGWNDKTGVVSVNTVTNDMQKYFDAARNGTVVTPTVPSTTPTPVATETPTWTTETASAEIIRRVNEIRKEAGLNELIIDPTLMATAQWHADDMVATGVFNHTASNGLSHTDLARTFGFTGVYAGENSYRATVFGPSSTMASWMNSEGHRNHILNKNHLYIGVGVGFGQDKDCVTLFMGW